MKDIKSQQKGNLYIFITALLWSTGGILLKYVGLNAILTNGLRSLFGFFVFCIYRKRIKIQLNKTIIAAAICLTLTNVLYVAANKLTTAANAIVIQYTAPIWVLIWNSIYHKKAPKFTELLAMILAFGGTVLFFFDGLSYEYMLGNLMSLFAGLCFSGVLFLNFLPSANSEESSALGFALSFIICIPWLGGLFTTASDIVMSSLPVIAILGVFQVGLAYVFFSKGSRLTVPVTASLIGLLEAILNPTWVYLFYGEAMGRFALIGAACILLGVVIQILTSKE